MYQAPGVEIKKKKDSKGRADRDRNQTTGPAAYKKERGDYVLRKKRTNIEQKKTGEEDKGLVIRVGRLH